MLYIIIVLTKKLKFENVCKFSKNLKKYFSNKFKIFLEFQ